jgi:predicted transcriptional regulator of viral defense system
MTTRGATQLREAFFPGDPLSLKEAGEALGGDQKGASRALSYLVRRGYFTRVRNRLWLRAGASCDPYRIGARVTEPYAFVYGSALALHGGGASLRTEVLIASSHRFDAFEFDGVLFRHTAPWPEGALTKVSVGPEFVWVTSLERTIVDCVRIPANAGGIEELMRSLGALPSIDPELVLRWVDHYGEANLAGRLAVALESADLLTNQELGNQLKSRRPRSRIYLEPSQRGGKLSSRWNVIVPDHLAPRVNGEVR